MIKQTIWKGLKMKLATIKNGTRDGQLVVVSNDLQKYVTVNEIAPTLQQALDNWAKVEAELKKVADQLNAGLLQDALAFDQADVAAPLPRAYQWCDGSAYLSHAELVRKARGAEMPEVLYREPLLYQGGSDVLIGARDDILLADDSWGLDIEAEIGVITDDVPMGTTVEEAEKHIKLVVLINDVSLRNVMKPELQKGFGFYQSKPATAFSPVVVTPEALGDAWKGSHLALPVSSYINGKHLGSPDSGVDLNFNFCQIIAHAAKTRDLAAGTIIGSGTVSNRNHQEVGSSCLQETRMLEIIATGEAKTPFLTYNDTLKIEIINQAGENVFGSIEQKVIEFKNYTRSTSDNGSSANAVA